MHGGKWLKRVASKQETMGRLVMFVKETKMKFFMYIMNGKSILLDLCVIPKIL